MNKFVIGQEEWCELPSLNIPAIKARVDSGAQTSSLHAFNIQPIIKDGEEHVTFHVHPIQNNRKIMLRCEAAIVDRRLVKSSSGEKEKRYVIRIPIRLNNEEWPIEVTLTNRDSMGYRMLLGRQAMENRLLIDPDLSFKLGSKPENEIKSYYKSLPQEKSGLKIVLLASNPDLYSNRRIMEAGEQRGHEMIFVNARHCSMNISSEKPEVFYRGGIALGHVDAVIPRIRPAITFYGCAITRQFETLGVKALNDSVSITRSRDKLRTMQMLSKGKINMPITSFADSPLDTKEIIDMVGGAPLIIKLLEGTQGKGVVLAETKKAAESVINAFKTLKANILVQEFVKEADGKDLRCFVIDGKVVGAIERQAAEGEFRANLHLGGKARYVKITTEEKKTAIKAAKLLGLQVAGVDIIRSKTGPKVLEVNSSPGLQGIEEGTGKDIAGLMIDAVEKQIRKQS